MMDPVAATPEQARERWRLPSILLPDGDERDLWIAGGRLTSAAIDGAERLPGRFALPGLVDAHAHVSVADLQPLDAVAATANLRALGGRGVLLVRDLGSPGSVTLEIAPGAGLPRFQAAGRVHAPEGRFFAALHDPVSPEALIDAALAEIGRGARWVKVIADWREPELSYDAVLLRRLVDAVHGAGARVAAHVQWTGVADVVAAGVDSIEHGCSLDLATLDAMAANGIA